ncbi:hypothetical protein BSU04_27450 [Caballeronia sordidicola]|uniref:Uncharacterized protein n=1 Tax=Caballeronia sordidicola TaxID=196367 RepID=A0A226WVV7_CABSO|nr:hypothetical protein BSU04_27450 [Caballeronia sordidicola]
MAAASVPPENPGSLRSGAFEDANERLGKFIAIDETTSRRSGPMAACGGQQ